MPEIVKWQKDAVGEIVASLAQLLVDGRLVVFPTDTSYVAVANALLPESVRRLETVNAALGSGHTQLAVQGIRDARQWVPDLSLKGRRLARRCWPGPLAICSLPADDSPGAERYPGVLPSIMRNGKVVLRQPCHTALLETMNSVSIPLVFAELLNADGTGATTADQVLQRCDSHVEVLLSDDPTYFGDLSTIVDVESNGWSVQRPGVVSIEQLQSLEYCHILFICSGNTCRSPLAAALCKKMLAERIGCLPEELESRGVFVQSAGLTTYGGSKAAPSAIAVARKFGVDLTTHTSQPVTFAMLASADRIWTMTRSHAECLMSYEPLLDATVETLSQDGVDIADPIGCAEEEYDRCAQQIGDYLQARLAELELE